MAITSINDLVNALGNSAQTVQFNKASLNSQVVGGFTSLWRASGAPGQGVQPTTATVCTKSTAGAWDFSSPTSGKSTYIGRMTMLGSNAATDFQIHDRLAHMGGLVGNTTSSQTVNLDVSSLTGRVGRSDYSEVQWWFEWYGTTGGSVVNITVTYTSGSGASGQTTTVSSVPSSTALGRMVPIIGSNGDSIQSIQSIQLNSSSGSAGNIGVTATKYLSGGSLGGPGVGQTLDWQALGLAKVEDDSCLSVILVSSATTSGTLIGSVKLVQG